MSEHPLLQAVMDDLRAFSAELLQVGLAPRAAARVGAGRAASGSTALLLGSIEALTGLVPGLLAELETSEAPDRVEEQLTSLPVGARLSRHAADWRLHGGQLLPLRWLRTVPVPRPDPQPLRWLLGVLDAQEQALLIHGQRLEKRVAEARASRRGRSSWARGDEQVLLGHLAQLAEARASLQRAVRAVRRAAAGRLLPSPLMPAPFPVSRSWGLLRRLALLLGRPEQALPHYIAGLLATEASTADGPYLYQRWCGVKLLQTLRRMGWEVRGDVIGALFLGGRIVLRQVASAEAAALELWVEPRLTAQSDHPSGWRCCKGGEVTPDFLFVTRDRQGLQAAVLDATLATDLEELKKKGRYLWCLETARLVSVAGCPAHRFPRLAWAAAPLGGHATLFESDGSCGALPLHPLTWSERYLARWLEEIVGPAASDGA